MKMTWCMPLAAGSMCLCSLSAHAGTGLTIVAEFAIDDHPNGGLFPPPYALRLDEVFGDINATYSAATFGNATLTVLQDNAGGYVIDIAGTFHGGRDIGGVWMNPYDVDVSMQYAANVIELSNGWQVNGFSALNSGTFTRLDTNESVTLYGMESMSASDGPIGSTFVFASDGWRIDGDDSSWVGRGWMTTNDDGTMGSGLAVDWLFSARVIPAPGAMAMLGLGGLVAARRRR